MRSCRSFLVAAWLAIVVSPSLQAQTTTQFWPEIQLRHKLSEADQAQFMLRLHDNLTSGQLSRAVVGTRLSHDFTGWFQGAAGYRHLNSTHHTRFDENRLFLDQIGRVGLPDKFGGDIRLREEFRWMLDGFSVRVRPGLLVRRPVEIGSYTVTPFVANDVFWDSRFHRVTHLRFTAGASFPVQKGFSLDPYFQYQFDPAGVLPSSNIIGFLMLASF